MARFVERSIHLPAPPRQVWEHLVDAALLGRWFGGDVDLRPRPGGPVRFRDERTELVGEIVRCERPAHLSWTWSLDGEGRVTRVALDLEPHPDGTTLTVTETVVERARVRDAEPLAVAT